MDLKLCYFSLVGLGVFNSMLIYIITYIINIYDNNDI